MKKIYIIIGCGLLFVVLTFLCIFQFTDLFHNSLLPKIKSITIEYVPGYNYSIALEENEKSETPFVEFQNITLKEKKLRKIKKLLNGIKKSKNKKDGFEALGNIVFSEDSHLLFGKNVGKLTVSNKTVFVTIPNALYQELDSLMNDNNSKILKKLNFQNCTLKVEGASIVLTNADNKKNVQSRLLYYPVSINSDYFSFDGGYKEIIQLDQQVIYLYSSNIGYIDSENEKTFVIFPYDLKSCIQQIYKKSVS